MSGRWDQARRLLCIRLDSLGDVLMTTPALRALKHKRSERHITLLTSTAGVQAAALVPEIDAAIRFDAPWMKPTAPERRDAELIEDLRSLRFDAAVIFTVYSQSPLPAAYLCYLAGIPLRLAHSRENPYRLLTDWVAETEPAQRIRHEVRRQLDLVAAVGCVTADERLSMAVPAQARGRIAHLVDDMGIDGTRPLVLIHPGASAPSRRYPAVHFAAVARMLADSGCQIVFAGSADEAALIEGIRTDMRAPSHSLAGALDLAELGALIASAHLLIGNNSGPVHIAAAVGTPVVDLYALTNPQHTPWQVESRVLFHDVPCKYCYKSVCPAGHHDCLARVMPGQVAAAARELLRRGARRSMPPIGAPTAAAGASSARTAGAALASGMS